MFLIERRSNVTFANLAFASGSASIPHDETSNDFAGQGGCLAVRYWCTVDLSRVNFTACLADKDGGGVVFDPTVTAIITDSHFTSCTAGNVSDKDSGSITTAAAAAAAATTTPCLP